MSRKNITDIQVCRACRDSHNGQSASKMPSELLMEATGECEKVCISAMERAYGRGLIECGVSLRTSWLTEKGMQLLGSQGEGE